MTQALVLNATYEPLCVVPSRRAVMLILDEKAELLHTTERMFRAERMAVAEPSVVRLSYFVKVSRLPRPGCRSTAEPCSLATVTAVSTAGPRRRTSTT